jgi:hypothetical protein
MISRYRITSYENDKSYTIRSMNEDSELIQELWQYHKDLGVEAYEADTNDLRATVKWELQGHWYNTSQIKRIYNLRAFL